VVGQWLVHPAAAGTAEPRADHVYVRGMGPMGDTVTNYPDATLRKWARHIRKWRREDRLVYVYFDNDQKSAAPANARRLSEILGMQVPLTVA
jgi:uncharacterized protein YecE (DUF72 family)